MSPTACRRFLWRALAALALALPALGAPPPVTLRLVASGLAQPLYATHSHDSSGRLFIVEKGGRIRILRNGSLLATPFLDISALVSTAGERGLLGLAFDPAFAQTRRFFVYYTRASDGAIRISSFATAAGTPDVADPATELEVITIPHPTQSNHNGGQLAFGPDGYLYAAVGDGGGSGDAPNNAQNLGVLLGKILRLDVNQPAGYAIPPTNPFVGTAGARGEIWAYGLRNPWRFSFDRAKGDLYIGDVGQGAVEEVDFQPFGAAGGRNYGWRVFEGNACFSPPTGCSLAGHVPPVLTYLHDANGGTAITGGYVYRGRKSRDLRGWYVYGDYGSNRIWAARREGATWTNFVLVPPPSAVNGPASFGEDERGELYVVSLNSGQVHAIDGPAPGPGIANDANGDGRADLLFRSAAGDLGAWLLNGMATPTVAGLFGAAAGLTVVAQGDFDGDGKSGDLLWRTSAGYGVALVDGGTVTALRGLVGAAQGWTPVFVGDFNGDGITDVVMRNTDGSYAVFVIEGGSAVRAFGVIGAGSGWTLDAVGDFNGDGKADLLASSGGGTARLVILQDGFGYAPKLRYNDMPAGFTVALMGDFDGDGATDLLWRDAAGEQRIQLLRDGEPSPASAVFTTAAQRLVATVAGDFDGDGKTDVVVEAADGSQAIALLDGVAVKASGGILGPASGWRAVAARDADGDGRADLLLRHTDGTYAIGRVTGTTMPTAAGLVGPGWTQVPGP